MALLGFRLERSGSLSLQATSRNLDLNNKGSLFLQEEAPGRLGQGQISSAVVLSPRETDAQKARASELNRLEAAGKRSSLTARSKQSEVLTAPNSLLSFD